MEQEQEKEDIIPGYSTIDDFTKNEFKVLVEAIEVSNTLPAERDWDFYKVHDSFNKIMNCEGDRVLRLMNDILHTQHQTANISNRDLEEKTEMIIEANDDILERVAIDIDELNGIKRTAQEAIVIQAVSAKLPVNGSWNQLNKATFSVSSSIDSVVNQKNTSSKTITLLTAENIIRPQVFFKDKIDNSNKHPWIPRITEKPNSLKPLAIFLEELEHGELYSHPYEFELEYFTPPPNQLQKVTPIIPKPLEETPLHEISTPEQLDELVDELRKHTVFAVDLEHHSYRTFMGITCLMQISTKDADYLIDTFTLRDKLCILNEVFTKPSIVKVFHGADSDVEWLQRDLSLYVVNMFDTHQAAKQLEYSELSLAHLLNRFCNVVPNKHFQLVDWRIRPLNDELKLYARMDTHYLIYIYHMLKNELIKKGNGSDNILKSVIRQSTQICKKRYVKPILHEESHLDFYQKCKRMFDNRQMYALKELYHWRDGIARAEDESTRFVLPNHMLLQIAETIPREMQGILACCNPVPPLVHSNLLELHRIILQARDQTAVKPILKEDTRSRGSTFQFAKVNVDSPLHCPHDLSKSPEFRDDLPTLLCDRLKNEQDGDKSVVSKTTDSAIEIEKLKSMYSVFNTISDSDDENEDETVPKTRNISFLAPYECYKLVKPYIQAEEEKAAAQMAANSAKAPEKISNDDRIAALHAHFVKVVKETPQIIPDANEVEPSKPAKVSTPQTLVAMGGSKKGKRKQSQDAEFHPDYKIPHNELHTPIPTRNKQTFNKKARPMSNRQKKRLEWKEMIKQRKEMKQVAKSPTQSNNQKEMKQVTMSPAQSEIPPPRSEFNDDSPMSNRQKKRLEWKEMNKQYKEMKQVTKSPTQSNNQKEMKQMTKSPAQSEIPPPGSEFNDDSPMSNRQKKRLEWKEMNKQHKEMKQVTKSPTQSNNQKEMKQVTKSPTQSNNQKKMKQMTKSPAQSEIPPPRSEFNDDSPISNRQKKRLEWKEMNKQYKEMKQVTKSPTQCNNQKEMKQMTKSLAQSETPPPDSEFNDGSPMSNRQKKRLEWKEMNKQHKEMKQVTKSATQSNKQSPKNNFTPFDYTSVDFQQFKGGAGGSNSKQAVRTQFKAKNKNKKFNKNSNTRSMMYAQRKQYYFL